MKLNRISLVLLAALLVVMGTAQAAPTANENDGDESKAASGLPLPRFASLRSSDVNMRTGPGTRYPIEWVLKHQGLPVEIVAEYEIWRRVRDSDGSLGWVHKSALSGKRMALITGSMHDMHKNNDDKSEVVAHLEMGTTGQVMSCAKDWCKVKFSGIKGYLRKTDFWGAYPNEVFD